MTQPISAQRILKGTYAQRIEREQKQRTSERLGVALMILLCVMAVAVLWASMKGAI